MSSSARPQNPSTNGTATERTYFEQQRDTLLGEIAISLEHVLQNINKLNRSLEGVIAVGNEFGSVEALWSQFENVMAKDPEADGEGEGEGEGKDSGEDREEGEEEETGDGDETVRVDERKR